MRFWISGPRIGRFRTGVSFRPDELLKPKPKTATTTAPRLNGGFIYIVRDANGLLKIGISSNPTARLATLRTASPVPLAFEYIGALRSDGYAIEAKAHDILSRHRLSGEWFDCAPEVAVGAISAAAHSLGELIAAVPFDMIDEVVRITALTDAAEAQQTKPRMTFSRLLIMVCIYVITFCAGLAISVIIWLLAVLIRG